MVKAVIFDLDETLLNRAIAVEQMFFMILEKCYDGVENLAKNEMLRKFKEYDKDSYGDNDKRKVFDSFFSEFPPKYILQRNESQNFWNNNFPQCFTINQDTINLVNTIKDQVKVAIITNGSTQRQKAKISNTNLDSCFDIVIISEEVGYRKPDKEIFELALNKLEVQPQDVLFVGDDIERDIGGCQNANINGIWLNPHGIKNDTEIKPYAEIDSLDRLINYIA